MNNNYAVDTSRWATLDIFNQMGNIYSEVGRSFKSQDTDTRKAAVIRAIDLFDAAALTLIQIKSPKTKEVLRAKEQFLDIVSGKHDTELAKQGLERYFLQFAVAARLRR